MLARKQTHAISLASPWPQLSFGLGLLASGLGLDVGLTLPWPR